MSIKFALLGTGRIAENELAPALNLSERATLWSVLSRDVERAADFAERHRAASPSPAYQSLDALLADPQLDAVLIATPDRLHFDQACAAAKAGKHVLTEKPMAIEISHCRAMIDACDQAGVKLGIAYHLRWHLGHRRLAEQVHAGEFGRIHHMRAQWTFPAPDDSNWRASDEVTRWWGLSGVGTHCLDQVRWLMCPSAGEIVTVRSVIDRSVYKGPHDETAVLALQFASGATAEICTSVLFGAPTRMEVYGSKAMAICDRTFGPHGGGEISVNGEPLVYHPANPYVGEIDDFAAAIEDGREPEVGGAEGARNVELLLQAIA